MSEHEDGAAATTATAGTSRESAPLLTLEGTLDSSWQRTVGVLLALTTDVLRVLNGSITPEYREVRDAFGLDAPGNDETPAAKASVESAKKSEHELVALSAGLQAYRDGSKPIDDLWSREAANALRSLLEIILRTPIPLPEEAHVTAEADGLDGVLAAAQALEATADGQDLVWTVRNLTARQLELGTHNGGAKWVLPAYGRRTLNIDPRVELELRDELAQGKIEVSEPRPKSAPQYELLLGIYFWVVIGAFFVGVAWETWGWIVAGVALVLPAAVFYVRAKGERRERLRAFAAELPTRLLQFATFLIVLAVGVIVPAIVIVFGADLRDEVRHAADLDASGDEYLTLVCRGMQLALISIATLLPALLYYQFDRDRLSTLREKFVHQIFRLDSSMTTLGAIEATYGRLIDETYGAERTGRYRKLLPGRRAPILVATILIMLGWLLVLLNPDVGLITNEDQIADLFHPRQTAPAFAFLGAYFFTLFALLRGYVRRDLRPKSYSDISVRIITVVILAWVLEVIFDDDSSTLLVFAFVIGIVPQAALNVIREFWQRQLSRWARRGKGSSDTNDSGDSVAAALADPLPLTNLEGIDLYDRTRLASEGVTNIEALAHHDLVELMLQTRIPVPRLIDWTDQAILHLHVKDGDRDLLSKYGIRTASDLLHARDRAEGRTEPDPADGRTELDAFLGLLDQDDKARPKRMQVVLDAIEDEEWMKSIRHWHGYDD